jgi:putative transposase
MRDGVAQLAAVLGVVAACDALGVPRSSFYYAQQPAPPAADRPPRPRSWCALSAAEHDQVRDLLTSERFVDQAPRTVYAIVLDQGHYLCSWRTMYRILAASAASCQRRAQRRHPVYSRPELLATGPCQVWSCDITKLRGPKAGIWYSL